VRLTHARALYSDAKINSNPSSCVLSSVNSVYRADPSSSEGYGLRSCVVYGRTMSRNKARSPDLVRIVEQDNA
jgi:hypothetical protein